MVALERSVDLAHLGLILILASAATALWLSALESVVVCALAVMGFNWQFVPPRGALTVDLHQHAFLLLTMWCVGSLVALLMARQRRLALTAQTLVDQAGWLQFFNETLRDSDDPLEQAPHFQDVLSRLSEHPVTLLLCKERGSAPLMNEGCLWKGEVSEDERARLWQCCQDSLAFGPGTDSSEGQEETYLPVRGKRASYGAVRLRLNAPDAGAAERCGVAQTLCDQMGLALERVATARKAMTAREEGQSQKLRNTLLAAISHDYRTPLATILGAASALHDQGDRLSREQRNSLASTIMDEVQQLSQLTDNTLQLARLDAAGVTLKRDWESAEEILGSVVQRLRLRNSDVKLIVRVAPDLPLLRCDAVLMVQMMNNLVANAIRYAGQSSPIEIQARRVGNDIMLSVGDRGPGVPPEWRDRIFEVFQRGDFSTAQQVGTDQALRGAGVGLAVCRAIASAHGGTLRVRNRRRGGASFECFLPIGEQPQGMASEGVTP